jgi:hypothetical protein
VTGDGNKRKRGDIDEDGPALKKAPQCTIGALLLIAALPLLLLLAAVVLPRGGEDRLGQAGTRMRQSPRGIKNYDPREAECLTRLSSRHQ